MISLELVGGRTADGVSTTDWGALARDLARERKIVRLLDPVSLPPFVTALRAFDMAPSDPSRTALFTISTWEPCVGPALPLEAGEPTHEQRFRAHFENQQATEWLRGLANNTLCQVAIARALRGPNLHVVGNAERLPDVLVLVHDALLRDADAALLVAFDPVPEARHAMPASAYSQAAAVMLQPVAGGARGLACGAIDFCDSSSVDVVRHWIAVAGRDRLQLDIDLTLGGQGAARDQPGSEAAWQRH